MSFIKKITKKLRGNTGMGAVAGLATGGLAGAVLGAGAGYYMDYQDKQAQKAADRATDKSNAYQKYLWDLTNQYNDPSAQMARLKAAGLNPNLVYGSGNVTGNTAGVADSTAYTAAGRSDALGRGLQVAQTVANLKQTQNQGELLKYQMGQTQAQTRFAELRAKDLANFLSGNGPSTYNRYRAPEAPSTDPDVFGEDLENLFFGILPYGSKAKKAAKFVDKYAPKFSLPTESTYAKFMPAIVKRIFGG